MAMGNSRLMGGASNKAMLNHSENPGRSKVTNSKPSREVSPARSNNDISGVMKEETKSKGRKSVAERKTVKINKDELTEFQ